MDTIGAPDTLVGMPPVVRLRGHDRGAVLVAVLLLMLALTALAHGLLVLARFEASASRASLELVRARRAAESAVLHLASDTGRADRAVVPVWTVGDSVSGVYPDSAGRSPSGGASAPSADVRFVGRLWRLAPELWLARGGATTRGGTSVEAARIVWAPDAVTRVAGMEAAVVIGVGDSVLVEGEVRADAYRGVASSLPDCPPTLAALDSAGAPPSLTPVLALPDTQVARLGPMRFAAFLERATAVVDGVGSPAPADRGGECLAQEPWNWGDPARGGVPCEDRMVVVRAADGVTIENGVGQGVLLSEGDLTLVDTRFSGLIVAAGRVTLRGATRIEGHVRADGGIHVGAGSSVSASACWVAAAVSSAPLRRPLLVPASGWILPF